MGLRLEGERQSIEPMAARLDAKNTQAVRQSLQHFRGQGARERRGDTRTGAQPGVAQHSETRADGGVDRR